MRDRWRNSRCFSRFPDLKHQFLESWNLVLEVSKHVRLASRILLAGLVMTTAIASFAQTPEQPRTRPVLRSTDVYAGSQEQSQQPTNKGSNEIDEGSVVRVN